MPEADEPVIVHPITYTAGADDYVAMMDRLEAERPALERKLIASFALPATVIGELHHDAGDLLTRLGVLEGTE